MVEMYDKKLNLGGNSGRFCLIFVSEQTCFHHYWPLYLLRLRGHQSGTLKDYVWLEKLLCIYKPLAEFHLELWSEKCLLLQHDLVCGAILAEKTRCGSNVLKCKVSRSESMRSGISFKYNLVDRSSETIIHWFCIWRESPSLSGGRHLLLRSGQKLCTLLKRLLSMFYRPWEAVFNFRTATGLAAKSCPSASEYFNILVQSKQLLLVGRKLSLKKNFF